MLTIQEFLELELGKFGIPRRLARRLIKQFSQETDHLSNYNTRLSDVVNEETGEAIQKMFVSELKKFTLEHLTLRDPNNPALQKLRS